MPKDCNFCDDISVRNIHGIELCLKHAYEALEHSADITTDFTLIPLENADLRNEFIASLMLQRTVIRNRHRLHHKVVTLTDAQKEFIGATAE